MAPRHRNSHLYCLVPDPDTARAVADDLRQTDVEPQDLRVVVRRETIVAGVPEAGFRESTAVIEAAKHGFVIGVVGGAVTGLVAAIEVSVSLSFACILVILGAVAGCSFGAWVSAMMGISRPHPDISQYQSAIDSGQVLMIIDVYRDQIGQIESLIRRCHPGATISTVVAAP